MVATIYQTASVIACSAIAFMGVFMAINRMGRSTCHIARAAWVFITTAAFGVLVGPLYGRMPSDLAETVMYVGVAFFLVFDRREVFKSEKAGSPKTTP